MDTSSQARLTPPASTVGVSSNVRLQIQRMRTAKNRLALTGASKNAAAAIDALVDPQFSHVPEDERSVWAMAAIIHCDLCRLVVALDECEREGVARLLCLGDIASKLYEARNWYSNSGTTTLRAIAERRSFGVAALNARLESIKSTYQVHRINKYADYRNKVGFHYDKDAISHLSWFASEGADDFFEIMASFVKFSGEWAQLSRDVLRS